MTSESANLLLAVVCLVSLVLAGGFTQTLIPGDGQVQFTIQREAYDCPPDRIIRPCMPAGTTSGWRAQLFEPFLEGLFEINTSGTQSTSSDSTTRSSPSESRSNATNGDSVGVTASPGTDTRDTPTNSGTSVPTTTDRQIGAAGLGSGFDWLLWPLLTVIGVVSGVGLSLGLRNSSIESAGDLLVVPGYALDYLLSGLVQLATRLAAWGREQWKRVEELLTMVRQPGPAPQGRSFADLVPNASRLVRRIPDLRLTLLGWLFGPDDTEGPGEPAAQDIGTRVKPPDPHDAEFEISRAWAWLAQRTSGGGSGHRTPDDIARDAVSRGYPRAAVRDLLDAFRDVTYGGFPPTDDRLEAARRAYETLRETDRSAGAGGE